MPRAIKCLLRGCRRGRVRGLDEPICSGGVCLDASAPGAVEVVHVEQRSISPTCACGQPTAAVRLAVFSIGTLVVTPLCATCSAPGQDDPASLARRFAEVVTPQELNHIKKHAPSMAEILKQLTPTAEVGDVEKALLAFDELSLDQVSALAKGLSEQTREALAALVASAPNL